MSALVARYLLGKLETQTSGSLKYHCGTFDRSFSSLLFGGAIPRLLAADAIFDGLASKS
jgi:hypothetical protein